IEKGKIVNDLCKKVKSIVAYFKHSVSAADQLRAHTDLKLIQSVETRWNSTYNMLYRFIELSDKISLILLKCPTAPAMLIASELQTAKEFISLLQPFEEATKLVCGESYVTASKVIPIVNTLKCKLEECEPTTDSGGHMKKMLLEEFSKRFSNIEQVSLLAIATILDPRFKNINFVDKIACAHAQNKVTRIINEITMSNLKNSDASTTIVLETCLELYENYFIIS
ncbi:Zinc finger BED domain-containing protein, partial [Ooceraea biroi]